MIEIQQDDYTAYQNTLSSHFFIYSYWTAFCRHITFREVLMGLCITNGTVTVGGI